MPEPITETLVPSNYAGKTVQWAKDDLAAVGLGIKVKAPGQDFHPPGTDELPLTVTENAPGSLKGQARASNGSGLVFIST